MLVNLKEVLKIAEEKNMAVGGFNALDLSTLIVKRRVGVFYKCRQRRESQRHASESSAMELVGELAESVGVAFKGNKVGPLVFRQLVL